MKRRPADLTATAVSQWASGTGPTTGLSELQLDEVGPHVGLGPDCFFFSLDVPVDLHVGVSGAFFLVAPPADGAGEGFLSGVRQQVFLQVVLGDEGLPAQVAAEGALLLVETDVGFQVPFGAEALAAQATAERLLAGVGQHVGVQPSHLPEGFPADATQEWFLAGVNPLVDLQDLDGGQALPAGLTGDAVGRFVSGVVLDVRQQSAVVDECLPAELAYIGSLPGVDPLVAPQGTGPRVGLPTGAAAVRFDPGVSPHVGLNVLVGFPADVTDLTGVSVSLQVVFQPL